MGKQIVIYRKEKYGVVGFGDLGDVRVGDSVQFWDECQHANRRIIKVNPAARVARLEAVQYGQYTLAPSKTLKFDEILILYRTVDDDYTPNIMDMLHPGSEGEPPPLEPVAMKRGRSRR